MIEFKNVTKSYGDKAGLSDVNLSIDDGEFVFLVGPSGAGKSTFIKLILKEIDPEKGQIFFRGRDITRLPKRLIPGLRRDLGIVFQDFRLLPKKTVYENVAFAMEARSSAQKADQRTGSSYFEVSGDQRAGGTLSSRAFRRRGAESGDCQSYRKQSQGADRGRAYGQPGSGKILGNYESSGSDQPAGDDGSHGDPCERHRRPHGKESHSDRGGRVVRDDAAGFYIQTDEPDMPVQAFWTI